MDQDQDQDQDQDLDQDQDQDQDRTRTYHTRVTPFGALLNSVPVGTAFGDTWMSCSGPLCSRRPPAQSTLPRIDPGPRR